MALSATRRVRVECHSLEDGLAIIAQRLVGRINHEATPDRARRLLTDAFLLTGLRLRRDAAKRFFRGVRAMEESDTFLAILDQGQEKHARNMILLAGQETCGPPSDEVKSRLENIRDDLERLDRML
jgi:hypothetical protein